MPMRCSTPKTMKPFPIDRYVTRVMPRPRLKIHNAPLQKPEAKLVFLAQELGTRIAQNKRDADQQQK